MSTNIAAIIPAYNEETTVANVVAVAIGHPMITTVIVVDDGSRDRTAKRAKAAGAVVILHEKNRGKAEAMETGVAAASHATHFLFLDADLVGFQKEHTNSLLRSLFEKTNNEPTGRRPVSGFDEEAGMVPEPSRGRATESQQPKFLAGEFRRSEPDGGLSARSLDMASSAGGSARGGRDDHKMVVGIRDRGRILNWLSLHTFPWISGERIVPRTLWEAVPTRFKHGFQIELALNAAARRQSIPTIAVILPGLSIRRKEQKVGLVRGLWERAKMTGQLVAAGVRLMLE